MAVDSATPGRLAIVYYRALKAPSSCERIEDWHESCAWRHISLDQVQDQQSGKLKMLYPFSLVLLPQPILRKPSYGRRLDDKLRKARSNACSPVSWTVSPSRVILLSRWSGGRPIGRESETRMKKIRGMEIYMEENSQHRLCIIRKHKDGKENYEMALDEQKDERYLYGRLLALRKILEEWALNKAKENRPTNAARLHATILRNTHISTWERSNDRLLPTRRGLAESQITPANDR